MGEPKTKVTEIFNTDAIADDDEAKTVVIDFNAIKAELQADKEPGEVDIKFSSQEEAPTPPAPPTNHERKVDESALELMIEDDDELDMDLTEVKAIKTILFDFKGTQLAELHNGFSDEAYDFNVVNELVELNKHIKSGEEMILIFYYNQAPKSINSLMKQLNKKFAHIKTMIIAKNLSEEKAKMHQKTPSGAKSYISAPNSFDEVVSKLKEI